jgi:hypothetical protein
MAHTILQSETHKAIPFLQRKVNMALPRHIPHKIKKNILCESHVCPSVCLPISLAVCDLVQGPELLDGS